MEENIFDDISMMLTSRACGSHSLHNCSHDGRNPSWFRRDIHGYDCKVCDITRLYALFGVQHKPKKKPKAKAKTKLQVANGVKLGLRRSSIRV
jgi:hypothetical protein